MFFKKAKPVVTICLFIGDVAYVEEVVFCDHEVVSLCTGETNKVRVLKPNGKVYNVADHISWKPLNGWSEDQLSRYWYGVPAAQLDKENNNATA